MSSFYGRNRCANCIVICLRGLSKIVGVPCCSKVVFEQHGVNKVHSAFHNIR